LLTFDVTRLLQQTQIAQHCKQSDPTAVNGSATKH